MYNKEETLLGLAKMGLRTNRREVFDLAINRGLDIENNSDKLRKYCISSIYNYTTLEWLYHDSDSESYKNYILSKITINCSDKGLTTLQGLERLTNLTSLDCYDNNLTDLNGIENLKNISTLDCGKNKLSDFEIISNLPKITRLYLDTNLFADLKGIEKLTKLHKIDLKHNPLPYEVLDMFKSKDVQKYYREL